MTLRACECCMLALERKSRGCVVKSRCGAGSPSICRVTALAGLCKPAEMRVAMTGCTRAERKACELNRSCGSGRLVALSTCDAQMLSDQRKGRLTVIEAARRTPPLRRVASRTCLAELPSMHILVTVRAFLSQSEVRSVLHAFGVLTDCAVLDQRRSVATATHDGSMLPFEVEPGALMVKPAGVKPHESELPAMMFLVAFDALPACIAAVKSFTTAHTHRDIIMTRQTSRIVYPAAYGVTLSTVFDAFQMCMRRGEGSGRDLCAEGLRHEQPRKKQHPCSQDWPHLTIPTSIRMPLQPRHGQRGSRT